MPPENSSTSSRAVVPAGAILTPGSRTRPDTEKAVKLMSDPHWDKELLDDLAQVMADASICGLGQAAPNPLRSVFKYFPEDL